MRNWWVNHKKTFRAEIDGGYIWSPKSEQNGNRSQFYENLRDVSTGDLIFSYADSHIRAIGVALAAFSEAERPKSFGSDAYWNMDGLLVPILWNILDIPFKPRSKIEEIRPLLPKVYSPLVASTGNGNQKCYLAEISIELAKYLILAIDSLNTGTLLHTEGDSRNIANIATEIDINLSNRPSTTKAHLCLARIGQGLFRKRVMKIEQRCRVTGVTNADVLIASHIKPWRLSDDAEKLDGQNGLLLAPHVDRLFDRGYISFSADGEILIQGDDTIKILEAWGIDSATHVGKFSVAQSAYLEFHRRFVFRTR
ncbi:HNH endonuclease [Chitinimonas sp. JJ19]|uniref:HNH endonuclease n=1 Tax=Chitinimonas sp. JJ19 TaxID=3109352 RepID=UPI003001FF00